MKAIVLTVIAMLTLSVPVAAPSAKSGPQESIPRWFCEVLRIC